MYFCQKSPSILKMFRIISCYFGILLKKNRSQVIFKSEILTKTLQNFQKFSMKEKPEDHIIYWQEAFLNSCLNEGNLSLSILIREQIFQKTKMNQTWNFQKCALKNERGWKYQKRKDLSVLRDLPLEASIKKGDNLRNEVEVEVGVGVLNFFKESQILN